MHGVVIPYCLCTDAHSTRLFRFWLLRVKAAAIVSEIETLAGVLYDYLHQRVVQVVMRQKADDPTDVAITCTNVLRLDRTLRKLDDDGRIIATLHLLNNYT